MCVGGGSTCDLSFFQQLSALATVCTYEPPIYPCPCHCPNSCPCPYSCPRPGYQMRLALHRNRPGKLLFMCVYIYIHIYIYINIYMYTYICAHFVYTYPSFAPLWSVSQQGRVWQRIFWPFQGRTLVDAKYGPFLLVPSPTLSSAALSLLFGT